MTSDKELSKEGLIFNIQKFSIYDGPGIRTTVFLKGCPLDCIWCHNPESKDFKKEISYNRVKCTGCGACVNACVYNCHKFDNNNTHIFDRTHCTKCGKCIDSCASDALEYIGNRMTVRQVLDEVENDVEYYNNSGGGMTVSGGEPMSQFDFTLSLLKHAKSRGIHNCLETCGFTSLERLEEVLPYTDIILYDYKETDSKKHKEFTGVYNQKIIDNLIKIDKKGAQIILRCPIIPGHNDRNDHMIGIAAIANRLDNIIRIDIEPYHPMGKSKSSHIGKDYELSDLNFAEKKDIDKWIEIIKHNTDVEVIQS